MSLAPGTRLGPYEITGQIGAGGMGEVYRAADTTLSRQVAIKILPDAFAHDPERLARFEREARTLASLNHPNIAQIYGLEKTDGIRAFVMELVAGLTLADRIAQGPIPVDEALPIAKQIAEALQAAHEQGIVHGDLKPANIKVRPDGTVKVLNFGVAKMVRPTFMGGIHATVSGLRGIDATLSELGVSVGTAAYMSFQQALGLPDDTRADVWTFGCVLYEMVTGRRAFEREDLSATLTAVRRGRPDWDALPRELSRQLRALIESCLQGERVKRIAVGDLSRELSKIVPLRSAGKLPQIFISYANDDKEWIVLLHRALEARLRQLLGFESHIWRDSTLPEIDEGFRIRRDPKMSGNDEPPLKALAALQEAVALICLVSPAYVQSARCRREFHEYVASRPADQDRHIFKVMVSPVPPEGQSPLLSNVLAHEFYVTDPTTGRTRALDRIFGPDADREFWLRLDDLAHDVAAVIRSAQPVPRGKDEEFLFMPGVSGTFLIADSGTGTRALRVFLCHASDDKAEVKALYRSLVKIGVDAWLDEERLLPGQRWKSEIRKAVKHSDAVLICLSRKSLTKTGFVQKEIKYALDVADEHPENALFLIPAKLEECEVPERLSSRQWVNLFEESGPGALAQALRARAVQLNVIASMVRS